MYKGNLTDVPVFKYESEATYFWVKLIRINFDEATHTATKAEKVQCYDPKSWQNMERMERDHGISWLAATGHFNEFEVLHDPTIVYDLETLKIKP